MNPQVPGMPFFSALKPGARVLIAGASGGIGRETLRLAAQHDVTIGAHYHSNGEVLKPFLENEVSGFARVRSIRADLMTADANTRLVEDFVQWAGGIDILVQLTGGVSRPLSWDKMTEADWRADLDLNLVGPFFLAQAAMKHMRAKGGKIVLMGTASARHGGGSDTIAYGVAKAGIECLTKGLARIGAPYKILINAVCPGFIDTGIHVREMKRSPDDLKRRVELVPLRRAGTPAEVASVILFLASEMADYVTGECLCVSGGDWL